MNDSFEYTNKNLRKKEKKKNCREWLIISIFLPQRSRRQQIDSIHTMYALDFRGLCSYNQLNVLIMAILIFVWINLGLFCQFAQSEVENGTIFNLSSRIMLMLISCGYPIFFSLMSLLLLVHNLCFDKQYEHMAVWHRNTMFIILQVFIFCGFIFTSFVRLHK